MVPVRQSRAGAYGPCIRKGFPRTDPGSGLPVRSVIDTVERFQGGERMILVASRSIFSLFSTDEETFANSLLWKTLLRTCSTLLWEGERSGKKVAVWGGKG